MNNIVSHSERWVVSTLLPERRQCYLVVLTCGVVNDYAAYAGIIYSHSGHITRADMEFVANYGDKISEEEARCLFLLPKDIYYRI